VGRHRAGQAEVEVEQRAPVEAGGAEVPHAREGEDHYRLRLIDALQTRQRRTPSHACDGRQVIGKIELMC